ncbi:Protein CBG27933 [Caenorhabditis briggsae]|uniref:Protein CBG27933 n=1 Tax=Caenorhabditis briggsae TaxID=6238 RepID=B6IJM5_CAEBR|nr:Protein CBG27933 [Caenorhabditis briggsae]CAS00105.1 Protein CBG27933 [Caenorhabditis briggsae]
MNEISLTSKPVVVTGPIDFSDFHREETARRLKEEQENNGMRLEFTKEYEWDASELDPIVRDFIEKQIEDCPFEETVVGYQTLLEMYNSYLGPEFYFLMMLKKAYNFREYESWLLFGY